MKKHLVTLLLVLSSSVVFAHGGGAMGLWDSQTFAYFVTSIVAGVCYFAMVWEPKGKRKKEKDRE